MKKRDAAAFAFEQRIRGACGGDAQARSRGNRGLEACW